MADLRKKEKVRQAVALAYNPEDDAPTVIASGKGALAERIIEKAQEAAVPVHRDDKLADTLSRLWKHGNCLQGSLSVLELCNS